MDQTISVQRMVGLGLPSELCAILQHMVNHDEQVLGDQKHWSEVIPRLQQALGLDHALITPFLAAWRCMYAAVSRLDELQDNDPITDPLIAALDQPTKYQLVFAYYILATSLLDQLGPVAVPERTQRLQQLWSTTMLRMIGGQYRDLKGHDLQLTAPIEAYEAIARAKTGATFGLAFGGAAILATDDQSMIEVFTKIGELYGTLLQMIDDLIDHEQQPNATLTLPAALLQTYPALTNRGPQVLQAFFVHSFRSYTQHVQDLVLNLPQTIGSVILDLFQDTFELHVNRSSNHQELVHAR
jgi:Polyprenyl synthetase